MNIVIAGLTAAGKTTHARLLARWLGFDYMSASQLMLSKLDVPPDRNNALWVNSLAEVERRRDRGTVDRDVNEMLKSALATKTSTVFDSWSLAWLAPANSCVRIWIESTRETRAIKARVSPRPRRCFSMSILVMVCYML